MDTDPQATGIGGPSENTVQRRRRRLKGKTFLASPRLFQERKDKGDAMVCTSEYGAEYAVPRTAASPGLSDLFISLEKAAASIGRDTAMEGRLTNEQLVDAAIIAIEAGQLPYGSELLEAMLRRLDPNWLDRYDEDGVLKIPALR